MRIAPDATCDRRPAAHGAREADRLVDRLEPVREVDLVALGAAQELDPRRALLGGPGDRVEGVEEPGRNAAVGGIEREPVAVHPPLEVEEVVEGDRATVDLEGDDPGDVGLREPADRCPVEALPRLGREVRAVRAAFPAEVVERECVLQRCQELVLRPRELGLDAPDLRELAPPSAVQAAGLGVTCGRGTRRPTCRRGRARATRRAR